MWFFLFLIFTVSLFQIYSKSNKRTRYILIFIYIVVWVLFVGGQYDVGTDYFSYYRIFSYPEVYPGKNHGEYIFQFCIELMHKLFAHPTATFIFISFCSILALIFTSLKSCKRDEIWLFFFLLITMSTAFNNQFNAVRQYWSTYVLSLSMVLLINRKYLFSIIFFGIAATIHSATIWAIAVLMVFYIVANIGINREKIFFILLIAAVIPLVSGSFVYVSKLMELSGNTHYLGHKYFKPLQSSNIYLKYMYFPFYLFSLLFFYPKERDPIRKKLYILGFLSYAMKLMCLASSVTNRFGMFFEVFMILPLVYYLNDRIKTNLPRGLIPIMFFLMIYFIKVTLFADGEYHYNSIFFIDFNI